MPTKTVQHIKLTKNSDDRGDLIACEAEQQTGISFKRFFVVKNVVGGTRGGHAHKYTDQVIACLSGQFTLKTHFNGNNMSFLMNCESDAVYLPRLTWVDMVGITEDCVILVLSSDSYVMANSLRSFSEFMEYCKHG